nr:hypothetical protein CFP56_56845 [Quercus suber]
MSEEAPVRPTADTEATSAKDGTHEEGGVSTASDASMKGFFADAKMIANEMAAAIATAASDVSTKALTPSPKPVLAEKGAPVEEKIPEGPGLVTKGISVKVSTPPRGDASPTGAQTKESPLTTPPVISSSDPFTALSQEVRGGPSLVLTPSSIPVTIGSKVPEKQEVAGVLIEPTPARSRGEQ